MIAAAAAAGAIVAGSITTLVTFALTTPASSTSTVAAPSTVTRTAVPPVPPAPLPVADADAQTCRAWATADTTVTAAALSQSVIPKGMTITDAPVQDNPAWKAGVLHASDLYGQAALQLGTQIAPGTSPTLSQTATATVGALRTLAESFKAFDPENGTAWSTYVASQKAMNWLCR